jgi:hypothetical protein
VATKYLASSAEVDEELEELEELELSIEELEDEELLD